MRVGERGGDRIFGERGGDIRVDWELGRLMTIHRH